MRDKKWVREKEEQTSVSHQQALKIIDFQAFSSQFLISPSGASTVKFNDTHSIIIVMFFLLLSHDIELDGNQMWLYDCAFKCLFFCVCYFNFPLELDHHRNIQFSSYFSSRVVKLNWRHLKREEEWELRNFWITRGNVCIDSSTGQPNK